MDSKRKYIRSKYLKRKNRPRNATFTTDVKTAVEIKNEELSDQSSEEVENQFVPKQSIPKDGWFPEYDSSSSSDFENLESLSNIFSNTLELKSDKNWFEKELDNIIPSSEDTINVQNDENQYNTITQQIVKTKCSTSNIKTISNTIKKTVEQKNNAANSMDNDEELEFLLSLKEPVFTGPVVVKPSIEDDRRFVQSSSSNEQKPIKSIDLEKWLDSVLDDR